MEGIPSGLEADEMCLLEALRDAGGRLSNPLLMSRLGWDKVRYREVRARLEGRGLVVRGRGRGGTLRLVEFDDAEESIETTATVKSEQVVKARLAEEELYEPVRQVLLSDWAPERPLDHFHVDITARQGRRSTGGKWTRPDLVVLAMTRFRFVPDRQFDVITFEVKPFDLLDITAVYEALSHLRAATHAYVLAHIPDDEAKTATDLLATLDAECQRHDVGLIVAAIPDDFASWDERVPAKRREPDAHRLDEFIATQISPAGRDTVQRWK